MAIQYLLLSAQAVIRHLPFGRSDSYSTPPFSRLGGHLKPPLGHLGGHSTPPFICLGGHSTPPFVCSGCHSKTPFGHSGGHSKPPFGHWIDGTPQKWKIRQLGDTRPLVSSNKFRFRKWVDNFVNPASFLKLIWKKRKYAEQEKHFIFQKTELALQVFFLQLWNLYKFNKLKCLKLYSFWPFWEILNFGIFWFISLLYCKSFPESS